MTVGELVGLAWAAAHLRVIADCAKRLLDATIGGNELERAAEANLRAALEGWR